MPFIVSPFLQDEESPEATPSPDDTPASARPSSTPTPTPTPEPSGSKQKQTGDKAAAAGLEASNWVSPLLACALLPQAPHHQC